MTAPAAPAPGYYADPLDPEAERWWDGAGWTESVRSTAPSPRLADVEAGEVPQLAPSPIEPAPARTVVAVQAAEPQAAEPEPEPAELEPQPAQPVAAGVPPGFYPDPYGQAPLRWWDGQQWTTATSRPDAPTPPATLPPATLPPATTPPATSGRAGSSAIVPRRGRSGITLPSTMRRVGLPGLAAVLVLVAALGVRLFVLDTEPADAPPAQLAAAVNLRAGDLPAGWSAVAVKSDGTAATAAPGATAAAAASAAPAKSGTAQSSTAPSGPAEADDPTATFDRDISRCIGAADPAEAVAFTSASPSWSKGAMVISSEVDVLRSVALAQQDLHARQGTQVDACLRRVGVPAMRAALAPSGVVLTGLAMQRLPGAAADGYALRMKMTATAQGRPVTVWTDSYGFVRGNTEIGLTVASMGTAPDRAVAATALRQLRTRATGVS